MFQVPEFQPSWEINLFQNFKRCSHDWSKLLQIVRCSKIYGWNSNRTLHSPFQQAAMKRRTWLDGGSLLTKTLLWLNRSSRISKNNNFYLKFTCKFINMLTLPLTQVTGGWKIFHFAFQTFQSYQRSSMSFHRESESLWEDASTKF